MVGIKSKSTRNFLDTFGKIESEQMQSNRDYTEYLKNKVIYALTFIQSQRTQNTLYLSKKILHRSYQIWHRTIYLIN